MTNRRYRVAVRFGDIDPIEYGGGVVVTSRGDRSVEYTYGLEDDENTEKSMLVYRADLPDDVWEAHDWADADSVAHTIGADPEALLDMGCSKTVGDRVQALEAIAGYYGWHELDQYPERYSVRELKRRWSL